MVNVILRTSPDPLAVSRGRDGDVRRDPSEPGGLDSARGRASDGLTKACRVFARAWSSMGDSRGTSRSTSAMAAQVLASYRAASG
jgi:hypothetical protein